MNVRLLFLGLAACAAVASAQSAAKPATKSAARPAATHTAAAHALPASIPPAKGIVKTLAALRYQEITLGTGAPAEPHKVYKVIYTGWLAADGHKFDASADHPAMPVFDHNLQVVKGADGKPEMKAGQPYLFPQGFGRAIPGFDNGFEGMKIGGKRRLFIPYQLAYGITGKPTGDPKNPGIPPKADLIFDVELVDVMDLPKPPAPPAHPESGVAPHPAAPAQHPGAAAPAPTAATPAAQPAASEKPASTSKPAAPSATPAASTTHDK